MSEVEKNRAALARMEQVRQEFEGWRRAKKKGARIPEGLWQAAVRLAGEQGINPVSQTLRVNYTELKKRVLAGVKAESSEEQRRPVFVEVGLGRPGGQRACVVEVEDRGGSRLRIQFQGEAAVDLVEWSRAFWSQSS